MVHESLGRARALLGQRNCPSFELLDGTGSPSATRDRLTDWLPRQSVAVTAHIGTSFDDAGGGIVFDHGGRGGIGPISAYHQFVATRAECIEHRPLKAFFDLEYQRLVTGVIEGTLHRFGL